MLTRDSQLNAVFVGLQPLLFSSAYMADFLSLPGKARMYWRIAAPTLVIWLIALFFLSIAVTS